MFKKVSITTALMAAGVITALGYSAVAQSDRPEVAPTQSTPNRPVPSMDRPALPNRPMPMPGPTSQMSALDQAFVMDAAHGGMAEVRLGQLALQKSNNPEVKRFAQQMIQEHSRANEELMRIVSQKGMTPPMNAGKYEAAMTRLMQLSGTEFDRAYMSEAGVNSHLEAAAVYQRQVGLGLDPDLKAFAARILPRVQGHLEMASQMTGYRFAQNNRSMSPMRGMNMPMPNMGRPQSMPGMNIPIPNRATPQSMPGMPGMDSPNMDIPPMSPMPQ
jgi:putative membrane protein